MWATFPSTTFVVSAAVFIGLVRRRRRPEMQHERNGSSSLEAPYVSMEPAEGWWEGVVSRLAPKEPRVSPVAPAREAPAKEASARSSWPPGRLSTSETYLDERIRTLCLVICATGVLAAAAYFLKNILIPFVLALAIAYLLTPTIDLLSCARCDCKYKLPRFIAVLIAMALALGVLFIIGVIVAESIAQFTANASMYRERVEYIVSSAYNLTIEIQHDLGLDEFPTPGPSLPSLGEEALASVKVRHSNTSHVLHPRYMNDDDDDDDDDD